MKICPRCKETKPKTEFHNNKSNPDKLNTYCKSCVCKAKNEHYKKYPERCCESSYNSRKKNPILYWVLGTLINHRNAGYEVEIQKGELIEHLNKIDNQCEICEIPFNWAGGNIYLSSKNFSPTPLSIPRGK